MPAFNASFRQWWRARTPEGRDRLRRRRIFAGVLAAGLAAATL